MDDLKHLQDNDSDSDDDDVSGIKKPTLMFSPELYAAISEVMPSDDPLDEPTFNPIDYINHLFPTGNDICLSCITDSDF
jgi:hypothetical protein